MPVRLSPAPPPTLVRLVYALNVEARAPLAARCSRLVRGDALALMSAGVRLRTHLDGPASAAGAERQLSSHPATHTLFSPVAVLGARRLGLALALAPPTPLPPGEGSCLPACIRGSFGLAVWASA